jgi:hypothetical protein
MRRPASGAAKEAPDLRLLSIARARLFSIEEFHRIDEGYSIGGDGRYIW